MRYLIKITPLEPYTFGDDRGFKYKDEKGTGKESYLMRSRELPEQTAILGILRYIILRQEGVLRTDFRYTRDERERIKEYIGGRSFSFMDKDELDFGLIKCISPVFITNEAEQILIKNPYNNKASKEGYDPIKMSPVTFKTRFGDIFLPDNGEYNAKKGYGFGFYNINTHKIHTDLFTSRFTAGNKKDNPDSKKKDGFFRREIYILKEGYSFAVYADIDIDELPKTTIGYMGKKKNAFKIEIIKKAYTDKLEDMVSKEFDDTNLWFYALSDLVIKNNATYKSFCIVEEKYQRNLETIYEDLENAGRVKITKSPVRFNLIKAGSVFYVPNDYEDMMREIIDYDNKNLKKIGYNILVKLGGR